MDRRINWFLTKKIMNRGGEKRMKKRIACLLALSLAAGLMGGCGGGGSKPEETAVQTGAETTKALEDAASEKTGGVLKIGVRTESVHTMLNFDLTGAGVDYYYSRPVYESLFKPNESGTVDPWLLEDYSYDVDAMTYTFHVRKGVTFSDGTVLDAEEGKWNRDHYL